MFTNESLQKIDEQLRAKVDPKNQKYFRKVVLAGLKAMYSKETNKDMLMVSDPKTFLKDPVSNMVKGIEGLMWTLYTHSGPEKDQDPQMPLDVLILAAMILMVNAMDYAEKTLKVQFTNDMIADATLKLNERIYQHLKISPQQMSEAIQAGHDEIEKSKGMLQQPGQPV